MKMGVMMINGDHYNDGDDEGLFLVSIAAQPHYLSFIHNHNSTLLSPR